MTPSPDASGAGQAGQSPAEPAITLGRAAMPSVAGRTKKAIGTYCSVLVTRPAALDEAQEILDRELAEIDLACSRFRPDSELSRLNRSGGATVAVSPLFARALQAALRAAEVTDGDVDPTCGQSLVRLGYDKDFAEIADDTSEMTQPAVPAAGWRLVEFDPQASTVRVPAGVTLDLGATAKALTADLAAEAIWRTLGCGVLVNLGGDISVAGPAPQGGWKVSVDDGVPSSDNNPVPGAAIAAGGGKPVVTIEAGGLATSSPAVRGWRRGSQAMHHILQPRTGQPAEHYWSAVTVAAASCVDANTASTAAIIRGREAPRWLSELGLPARLARAGAGVTTTAGWPE